MPKVSYQNGALFDEVIANIKWCSYFYSQGKLKLETDLDGTCFMWQRLNGKAYNSHRRKFHCRGNDALRQSRSCPFCDRKFWDKYHLQRHVTVHSCECVL